MTNACGHRAFRTYAAARERLLQRTDEAKQRGHVGKSFKRLNIFRCGDHWHVGRKNTYRAEKAKTVKPPTAGQLRRKAEREMKAMRRHVDRLLRQCLRDLVLGTLAEESLALQEPKNKRRS